MRQVVAVGMVTVLAAPVAARAEPTGCAACSVIVLGRSRLIGTDPLPAREDDRPAMNAALRKTIQARIHRDEPGLRLRNITSTSDHARAKAQIASQPPEARHNAAAAEQ